MKKPISFIILVLLVQITIAQKLDYGNDLSAIKICNAIQGNNFLSESEADSALDKILNVIGASKRFVLQPCDNINNAVALSYKGIRYIMYDPEFMQMLSYSNNWSNMFVLAHEVGHHINGHSVDAALSMADIVSKVPLSKKRIQELEADEFAGFVLGRLGATLSDATSAVSKMSDGDDSYSTHPNRSKRIAAITKGFNESGGKVDSSKSVEKGKIVDSPYSNSRFSGVKYVSMDYAEGIYTGYVSVESNLPFGYGEIRYSDGFIYTGEWSSGSFNGYGKTTWASGSSYEGYFVKGVRSGEGVYTFDGGQKDVGVFSNGSLAKGISYTENYTAEGTWKNGSAIKVTYKYKNGGTVEYGFLDGSNGEGYGERTLRNGAKIFAVFKDGVIADEIGLLNGPNGQIKRRNKMFPNKRNSITQDTYVLDFIPKILHKRLEIETPSIVYFNNSSNGNLNKAFLRDKNGKYAYNRDFSKKIKISEESQWQDGYAYSYSNEIKNKYGEFTYAGDVLGYGEMEWVDPSSAYVQGTAGVSDEVDGTYYEGYFKSGTLYKAGYGEIFYGNSDEREYYKGMWWNDKKNGYGFQKYKDGKIEKGIFRNNRFYKAGEPYSQLYENMKKTLAKWML
jgi:hypothetical protein